VIVAVRFPTRTPETGYAFAEVTQRQGDFAICAVAAVVGVDSIRLGVGGVADCPTVRDWPELPGDELDNALNDFAWDLGGTDDAHATAAYRREVVRRLGRRVIEEARHARTA
jgi:2-furoyl-CoA dehydrogenase FAD binding subunit